MTQPNGIDQTTAPTDPDPDGIGGRSRTDNPIGQLWWRRIEDSPERTPDNDPIEIDPRLSPLDPMVLWPDS